MKNLIAYIPAGFPSLTVTRQILRELNGMPLKGVEIGVPFSDPVADGPVIQQAYQSALDAGITLAQILDMLEGLSLSCDLYLMSYLNPLMNYPGGRKVLCPRLRKARVKGLIIPDLPLKETDRVDLDFPKVVFTAPNTTEKDIEKINRMSPPFVYYVARYGVTGARSELPGLDTLRRIKKKLVHPLYAGFGISTPQQVEKVNRAADGAIAGSVLVKAIASGAFQCAAERVAAEVRTLLT